MVSVMFYVTIKLMKQLITFFKKFWKFIIPILLIVVLIIIILWPQIRVLGMQQFIDDQQVYSFYYPKNWQEKEGESFDKYNEQVEKGIVKSDSSNTSVAVYVEEKEGGKNFDRDRSIEEMDKFYEHRHNSFEKIYSKKIDFLGIPAIDYRLDYSYIKEFRSQTHYRSERQIIFYHNGKIYEIIFSTNPQDYNRDETDFETILKSFQLL